MTPIPLVTLEPVFMRVVSPGHWQEVDRLEDAQGMRFLCPVCFAANGGRVGTHSVVTWFRDRGTPEGEVPKARWQVKGTGFADLVLTPSILLPGPGCGWHGFIGNPTPGVVT